MEFKFSSTAENVFKTIHSTDFFYKMKRVFWKFMKSKDDLKYNISMDMEYNYMYFSGSRTIGRE